jgi:hypothetical protein
MDSMARAQPRMMSRWVRGGIDEAGKIGRVRSVWIARAA